MRRGPAGHLARRRPPPERRVRPLLPKIGKRLGASIPAVMAAAREGTFEIHADGSVTLGGAWHKPNAGEPSPPDQAASASVRGVLFACLRKTLGAMPRCRLKARLNENSEA